MERVTSWTLILILFHGIHFAWAEQFKVTGPAQAIVARVHGVAILECQLIPENMPRDMEIRWMRSDSKVNIIVHLYRNSKDVVEEQDDAYKGRTELFKNDFSKGNISLRLSGVRLADEGDYLCMVEYQRTPEQVLVPLKVASLGLRPAIRLEGYQGNGIRIQCNSSGWYPLPSLHWTSSGDQNLSPESQAQTTKDTDGFYRISSSMEVMSGPADIRCRVEAPTLKIQESKLQIPDEFFPRTSKFFIVFMVFLVLLFGILAAAGWLYYKKRTDASELYRRPTLAEHESLGNEIAKLETLAESARSNFALEKKLSTAAAERVIDASVSVTFDQDTANPYLSVSKDCLTVSFSEDWKEAKDNSKRFTARLFVMATEGYQSGRQYWEVWVGNKPDWDLGVAYGSIPRNDWVTLSPSNGIWTIGKRGQSYEANDEFPTPLEGKATALTIGIYLDRDTGNVSFYDAEAMAHIYTFQANFTEKIYPFFSPWGSQEIMKISPL
ncbi:butyrophilin subfamily 3 member A3-like [Pristis pectinata]|uniref:butyrophilin subfamily 3 member A3-like n=1 Tax=Pristis pectinata TaxID=685728 RepID=UPI00223CC749|nr:butyrophilin subfamily 3 member A3-like [Pristis pectinata]XP_051899637.1 butyrophilin subfamily 3 member A3-like [Pristis pectinata]